jgi:hypothetical protein
MSTFMPDFMLYELTVTDTNAISFLHHLKKEDLLGPEKIKFFVLAKESTPYYIRECIKHGASDFLVKPLKPGDLMQRLLLHLRAKKDLPDFSAGFSDTNSAHYYMYLTDLLLRESLKGQAPEATLHRLTALTAISLNAVRVSTICCDFENRTGWVFGSSDKRDIKGLEIDLFKYPEVLYVLRNEKLLAIDNLAADPTMHFVTKHLKDVKFNSLIVCPIGINGKMWGALSARMADSQQKVSDFQIRYAQLVAHVMGLIIRGDKSMLDKAILAASSAPQSA